MKTFKTFLTENESYKVPETIEECIPFIRTHCKNYVEEFRDFYKNGIFFYRGDQRNQKFMVSPVRKDRKPKDTPEHIQDKVDYWFEDKFGKAYRKESAFVMMDDQVALNYGYSYIVFPMGEYDYIASKRISDLFVDYFGFYIGDIPDKIEIYERIVGRNRDKYPWLKNILTPADEEESDGPILFDVVENYLASREHGRILINLLMDAAGYKENDKELLRELGLKSNHEIMFNCKHMFYISWALANKDYKEYLRTHL